MKGWKSIYPIYLDGTKKRSEGRRISKEDCPSCSYFAQDILVVCGEHLGLKAALELRKRYSKDPYYPKPGRVRIDLANADQSFTKTSLLRTIAEKLPEVVSKREAEHPPPTAAQTKVKSPPKSGPAPTRRRKGRR